MDVTRKRETLPLAAAHEMLRHGLAAGSGPVTQSRYGPMSSSESVRSMSEMHQKGCG